MLTSLYIRNFALIEEIRVDCTPGLTVITGETGAGKSIVIDALGLVLGERADTTMVRQGSDKAVIEAEFDAGPLEYLRPLLENLGAEWQDVLILRRDVSVKGVSRAFVNDSPVPVSELRALGNRLVDIHGQHEHQSLLRQDTHRAILDSDPAVAGALAAYREVYARFVEGIRALDEARGTRDRIEERRLVAEHQLREIAAVNPQPNEDEDIERELRVVEHAEKLATAAHQALELLYDADNSVVDMLGRSERLLDEITRIDPTLAPQQAELTGTVSLLSDIAHTLRDYAEGFDFRPDHAERLRHRLAELLQLTRKYRMGIAELIDKRDALEEELRGLDNIDDRIASLESAVDALRAECSKAGLALTRERERAGAELAKHVPAELRALGIKQSVFASRLLPLRVDSDAGARYLTRGRDRLGCGPDGCEDVEFYLSTNLGEDPKPLARVVSGGEVSRIMLALKGLFAGRDRIPIMVFDEIDVGVSGTIARKVGEAMRKLARAHQIIAITHLPQIAGLGDRHLLVEKHSGNGRTSTRVLPLDTDARLNELARLLSGDRITEAALQSARELLAS
ncbi:MAG TPA: DNA repair protein RecN [Bacteroidota bacterium]|nr:DNA repair protein RecN [Bacteroidota bacterium]